MQIFVRNLSFDVDEAELEATFARFGPVRRVTIPKDHATGGSRGIAFVDVPEDELARRAMRELDGTELRGRPLRLEEARPREARAEPRPNHATVSRSHRGPTSSNTPVPEEHGDDFGEDADTGASPDELGFPGKERPRKSIKAGVGRQGKKRRRGARAGSTLFEDGRTGRGKRGADRPPRSRRLDDYEDDELGEW